MALQSLLVVAALGAASASSWSAEALKQELREQIERAKGRRRTQVYDGGQEWDITYSFSYSFLYEVAEECEPHTIALVTCQLFGAGADEDIDFDGDVDFDIDDDGEPTCDALHTNADLISGCSAYEESACSPYWVSYYECYFNAVFEVAGVVCDPEFQCPDSGEETPIEDALDVIQDGVAEEVPSEDLEDVVDAIDAIQDGVASVDSEDISDAVSDVVESDGASSALAAPTGLLIAAALVLVGA